MIQYKIYNSPVGLLILGASEESLVLCDWIIDGQPRTCIVNRLERFLGDLEEGYSDILAQAASELDEYFSGTLKEFKTSIKMYGTPFQIKVWELLRNIPYGETWSYQHQADILGCPKAVRAVANANRMNSLSIVVPCHRVIGSNNKLTGYAGGLDAKKWLLDHECRNLKR